MTFTLPKLPYPKEALAPHLSADAVDYHYSSHHQAYVNNLNRLTEGSDLANKSLIELIKTQKGPIFNNAGQIWNHTFYWNSLSPVGGGEPKGKILEEINHSFGSFSAFKEQFSKAASGHFGSGWAWLIKNHQGKLQIETTANAESPLQRDLTPLLTCDVWEHAYYIDYRNTRAKYIEAWWNIVNWDFAKQNLS